MTGALVYHQAHPAKLAVDVGSSVASCALLWRGEPAIAMVVAWIPSIAASIVITRFVDLQPQRDGAFGRYVADVMTPAVTAQRLVGQLILWIAAYRHEVLVMAFGAVVIVLAWLSRVGASSRSATSR